MNNKLTPASQAVLRELTVLGRSEFTLDEVFELAEMVNKDNGFHAVVLRELKDLGAIEPCPDNPAYFRIAQRP